MYVPSFDQQRRMGFLGGLGAEPGLDPGTWRTQPGVAMPRAFKLGPQGQFEGVLRPGPPPGVQPTGQAWGPDGMFQPWTGLHIAGTKNQGIGFQCWESGSPYASNYGQECGGGSWQWTGGWLGIAFAQPQYQETTSRRVVLDSGQVAYMPTEYRDPRVRVALDNLAAVESFGVQVEQQHANLQTQANQINGLVVHTAGHNFWWHPSGWPVILWNGGDLLPPPGYVQQPICEQGELTTYAVPGVMQTWPKVGRYLVTPSPDPTLYNGWKNGSIPTGSTVKVCGLPTVLRTQLAIAPDRVEILDRAAPPAPGEEPTYPEEWKPEITPREPTAPGDEEPGDELLTETFVEPVELPTGGTVTVPGAGGGVPTGAPTGAAAGAPAQAGFGGVGTKETVVLFGLLALPFLFGKKKK